MESKGYQTLREYEMLSSMRSANEDAYMSLSMAYLAGISIIMAAVAILLTVSNPPNKWVTTFFCIAGIFISLIMALAQSRCVGRGGLVEKALIKIEEGHPFFQWPIYSMIMKNKNGIILNPHVDKIKYNPNFSTYILSRVKIFRLKYVPIIFIILYYVVIIYIWNYM